MPVTEMEMGKVKEIILNGARRHFPPEVRFLDANVTVKLDAYDEEIIDIELLYAADNPVLDGHLMNTLFRVIDEPIIGSGITARTLIHYIDINDPTWQQYQKPAAPPPAGL